MDKNLNKLNQILLSEDVKNNFYKFYNNDGEFKNWLLDILPEVENCRLQTQNNPWHIFPVLDHILVSVEEVNRLSINLNPNERKSLSYIMFLHDIGKPESHQIKLDKDGNKKDSFPYHNVASEKITSRVISDFGFSQTESNIIKKLVYDHDFFMFLFKEKDFNSNRLQLAAKEKIEELNQFGDGQKLNKMLVIIGLADNYAQNPYLTKPSVELIKQYKTISDSFSFSM